MVFDPKAAPRSRKDFLAWYELQTDWQESHGYDDPSVPSPELRAWFQEMILSFPPMNGPLAMDDFDNPKLSDYSLGRSVIYVAFNWSESENAYEHVVRLAGKYRLGFFDVSAENGEIWLPNEDGKYDMLVD
jgi:hypothetical protein